MKQITLITFAVFFISCGNSVVHETENNPWNKTEVSNSNPEVDFINQFIGKVFDGDIRKDIEERNGEMKIDFDRSKLNEYWICLGSKTGVVMKIKEPDYTIIDAWLPE